MRKSCLDRSVMSPPDQSILKHLQTAARPPLASGIYRSIISVQALDRKLRDAKAMPGSFVRVSTKPIDPKPSLDCGKGISRFSHSEIQQSRPSCQDLSQTHHSSNSLPMDGSPGSASAVIAEICPLVPPISPHPFLNATPPVVFRLIEQQHGFAAWDLS